MHEENIYADEQCGLFKRKVKEQLFHSSILMLTKNKKMSGFGKRTTHSQGSGTGSGGGLGGYTGEGTLNGKQMKGKVPAHKNQQPSTCRSDCHE